MSIGVLALQGAFVEHIEILKRLGVQATAVRRPEDLKDLDGIIIPGGESTSIVNLMQTSAMLQPLKELAGADFPILGTCAGMVCLAREVADNSYPPGLAAMDIVVRRNAFGRQVDSFEAKLAFPALGERPYPAVFIRAPIVESTAAAVQVLARLNDGSVVAVRQGRLLATAFHPELSADIRLHRYFLKIVAGTG
ncbi:MAG: pyridoxal 5'-phosphate synthase glutaminase subunit PdxT [Dehalococcoidales bacterium]